jgi:hypothetical protein
VVCPPPITNHQSPITNQQSTINNQQSTINNQQSTINNQQSTITPCKTLLGSKSAVKDFWFLPGDSPLAYRPKPLDCFGESGLDGVLGGISVP